MINLLDLIYSIGLWWASHLWIAIPVSILSMLGVLIRMKEAKTRVDVAMSVFSGVKEVLLFVVLLAGTPEIFASIALVLTLFWLATVLAVVTWTLFHWNEFLATRRRRKLEKSLKKLFGTLETHRA